MQVCGAVWCCDGRVLLSLISIQFVSNSGLVRKFVGGQPYYKCRDAQSHIVRVLWCESGQKGSVELVFFVFCVEVSKLWSVRRFVGGHWWRCRMWGWTCGRGSVESYFHV